VLDFVDELNHIVAESSRVVNGGLVRYLLASLIVSERANGMEHRVWSFVLCSVDVSIMLFCQALVRRSLIEFDCIVDSFC